MTSVQYSVSAARTIGRARWRQTVIVEFDSKQLLRLQRLFKQSDALTKNGLPVPLHEEAAALDGIGVVTDADVVCLHAVATVKQRHVVMFGVFVPRDAGRWLQVLRIPDETPAFEVLWRYDDDERIFSGERELPGFETFREVVHMIRVDWAGVRRRNEQGRRLTTVL